MDECASGISPSRPGRYGAAISEHPDLATAVGETLGQVYDDVGPAPAVAVLCVTDAHLPHLDTIADAVRSVLAPSLFVGATATSVIGNAHEAASVPAISLWAASELEVRPIRIEPTAPPATAAASVVGAAGGDDTLVVWADPWSVPVEPFLAGVRGVAPEAAVLGGLASTGSRRGGIRLVLDDVVYRDGGVGFAVPRRSVRTVVSQGCRPIGDPYIVTAADRSAIIELGGRRALTRLQETLESLDDETRILAERGIHAGIVVDERRSAFARGDFVVRDVRGVDPRRGSVSVGADIDVGQTVQFQVRDARSASEDLRALLSDQDAAAALLFTCDGRGSRLFDSSDHDAATAHELLGGPAIGGMSCAGEIGPVGGRNHLHEYTASLGLFA